MGIRRLGHVPALDGLRAIAVILVLLGHTPQVAPEWVRHLPHGALGVDVFFVLSGFLITALLLRDDSEGHVRFWPFYRRRAMRLLPALYAVVIVYWLYTVVTDLPTRNVEAGLLSIVLYYRNWYLVYGSVRDVAPGLGHMWSLAVEEQFYLVWPAVTALFLGVRRRLSVVVTVLLVGILLIALHRTRLWETGGNYLRLAVRTDTRADSILVGALIAHLWVRRKTPTRYTAVAACIATAIFTYFLVRVEGTSGFYLDGGYTIVAACVGVVMLALLADNWFAWPFKLGWLRAIGRVSYGLYLWHLPIFFAVTRYAGDLDIVTRLALAYGITTAFTLASWFLLERPILRWKDRIEARERAAAPQRQERVPQLDTSNA